MEGQPESDSICIFFWAIGFAVWGKYGHGPQQREDKARQAQSIPKQGDRAPLVAPETWANLKASLGVSLEDLLLAWEAKGQVGVVRRNLLLGSARRRQGLQGQDMPGQKRPKA